MANLKLFNVNSLPNNLLPNSLYILYNSDKSYELYQTNGASQISHDTVNESDVAEIIVRIIKSMIGVPGGIPGLNNNGVISKIDGQNTSILSNDAFVWKSQKIIINNNNFFSVNYPIIETIFGNMQGMLFSYKTTQQVFADIELPFDYAEGTDVYIRANWVPISNVTGDIITGLDYSVSKGFSQTAFNTNIVTLNKTISVTSSSNLKIITTDFTDPIPGTLLEPGSVIKIRLFRDARDILDTFNDDVHLCSLLLVYQISRIGTRNNKPPFLV